MHKFLLSVCLLLVASTFPESKSTTCPEHERLALIQFVNDFLLYEGVVSSDWNVSIDPCSWQAVRCDNLTGNVIAFTSSSVYRGKVSSASPIFLLHHLQELSLNYVDLQRSSIPEAIGKLQHLTILHLCGANITGIIPLELATLPYLQYVDLSLNDLSGPVPLEIFSNPSLYNLRLFGNRLNGSIPSKISIVSNLAELYIGNNEFTGRVPSWLFTSSIIQILDLSNNYFSGPWEPFPAPFHSSLSIVDMHNNSIGGPIPRNFFRHVSFVSLNLADNQLSGDIPWGLFKDMVNLTDLSLANNRGLRLSQPTNESILPAAISVSLSFCNLTEFPSFLHSTSVRELNVSNNMIVGRIFLRGEDWRDLLFVDASHNLITGFDMFPGSSLFQFDMSFNSLRGPLVPPPSWLHFLLLTNNQLSGEITRGFCSNLTSMEILDLSYNNLEGSIPACLLNASDLTVLNLQHNLFHGEIPQNLEKGIGFLILSNNKLEGRLPRSFQNSEVLDVANNMISDTFPGWSNRVLILRSNKFYGEIDGPGANTIFYDFQILDISDNSFTGNIPQQFIRKLEYMHTRPIKYGLLGAYVGSDMEYRGHRGGTYKVSWTTEVTMEGKTFVKRRVPYTLTIFDLSNNKFSGFIPDNIGWLENLKVLNVSRNNLTGAIPSSVGRMRNLKSLDFSYNMLEGTIPWDLMNLQVLEYFNVSYNRLQGHIPKVKSFSNASYIGNWALCGTPMTKMC